MKLVSMAQRVEGYLAYRRALGYQLRTEGGLLQSFARYADESGHEGPLTTELALRWARLPQQAARLYQARRLEVVHTLAKYLAAREPGTDVPPRLLLGAAHARGPAFIYAEADINRLLAAARRLPRADELRRQTYVALIGLLACTGLRIGEALGLQTADVDLRAGILTVRQTKFHKSRLVPLHASAIDPLRTYVAVRDRRWPSQPDRAFFVSRLGRTLPYTTVRHTFHLLQRQVLPTAAPIGRVRPRLHDVRHTFVCRRLLAWYRDGTDIDRAIDLLSAYVGHVKVTDTYWYITGLPELMQLAGRRFEQFSAPLSGGAS